MKVTKEPNGKIIIEIDENKEEVKEQTSKIDKIHDGEIHDDKVEIKEKTFEEFFEIKEEYIDINELKLPFVSGQLKITMSTPDRIDLNEIADIDMDIHGYDRIPIHDILERETKDLCIINDGPDNLFVLISYDGNSWTGNELFIFPGECWKLHTRIIGGVVKGVHELRLRSSTQGNKYRVTEYEIISGSSIRSVI